VTHVLVVASSAEARARLEAAIRGRPGLRLVAATPAEPLARQVAAMRPDVVVLDLRRPGTGRAPDDLALLRAVAAPPGAPSVVVLTERAGGPARADLRRAGARGVLPLTAAPAEIAAAVDAVAAGLVVLHPDVLEPDGRGSRAARSPARPGATAEPVTPREREILAMLAEGLGNKAIAARLGISTHTVKFHVAAILQKLGARSRAEAVTIGVRIGLLLI
jgi:DNA-binding NarL/FixJ family response regulator